MGLIEPVSNGLTEECRIYREERTRRHDACKDLRIFLIEVPSLATAHGKARRIDACRVDRVTSKKCLNDLLSFRRSNELMVLDRYEEEVVLARDIPPACNISQIHGRISAAVETDDERHLSLIHQSLVVVSEISDLMCRCLHRQEFVVRRSCNLHKACVFGHVKSFEVRLKLNLAAPHLELPYERIEVADIVRFILN